MTTDKAVYFYAAYALVMGVLVAYIGWLGMKVKTLEAKLEKRPPA